MKGGVEMTSVSYVTGTDYSKGETSAPRSSMDQISRSDFLNLLVTQLKNQDPMNPIEDADFAAQVVQFNMLEELLELKNVVSNVANNVLYLSALDQAGKLVGRKVKIIEEDSEETVTGIVEKTIVNQGVLKLVIDDKEYNLSQVAEILDGQGGK
jgi:flagellar basal-body rod modification protein FlgD